MSHRRHGLVASRPSAPAPRRWPWLLLAVTAMIAAWLWTSPRRSLDTPADAPAAPRSVSHPPGEGRRGADALASATRRATGRVIDEDGVPVADVEVIFAAGGAESSTPSGTDGHYAVDLAPGRYRAYVRAEHAMSIGWRASQSPIDADPLAVDDLGAIDHATAVEVDVHQDLDGIDLVVVRTGIIEGRVVDTGGRPVAGAVVHASALLDRDRRSVVGDDLAETAADGRFRIQAPRGRVELRASHPAFARGDTQDGTDVDVEAGAVTRAEVVLVVGCVVRGRVVDRDGAPVGVGIVKVDYGGALGADGRIEADGSFRWSAAVEGDTLLSAHPWGAPASASRLFPCRDGARFDDVQLEIAATDLALDGTLLTARGTPAVHAYLEIEDELRERWARVERTGADGRWAVHALAPGNYRVTARLDGEGVVSRDVTVPARDVALRFGGTGSLAGRVEGVDRGTVEIEASPSEGASHSELGAAPLRRSIAVVNGRYRIDGLPACSLELTVSAGGKVRQLLVDIRANVVTDLDVSFPPPGGEPDVPRDLDGLIDLPMA